jgi:hypothetical protein
MSGVWAEVWFSYFSSVFRPILVLFFFISFCFSVDSGWLTSQYFWKFLTLRLAAFDMAKPALPHPVRPPTRADKSVVFSGNCRTPRRLN